MAGAAVYRGIPVNNRVAELVKQCAKLGGKDGPKPADVIQKVVSQPDFPGFYTQVAAMYGECPEGVDALSRLIIGINDRQFQAANMVETNFDGAICGVNPKLIISRTEVETLQPRMVEAQQEFLQMTADKKIAWTSTNFEDSTNIEQHAPSDLKDFLAYGQALFAKTKGNMLAIGVGGSGNGPKAITGAFMMKNGRHLGHTFDSDHIREVVKDFLAQENPGHIIVASLSGTTPETLTNYLYVLQELKRAGIPRERMGDYVTFQTGGDSSVLREIGNKLGINVFFCKPQEGGRWSIWTVIGALWQQANGVDVAESKAGAMLETYRIIDEDMNLNPAMKKGAVATVAQRKGVSIFQHLVFSERLATFADFVEQAWSESVEDGDIGMRIKVSVGPNWQHIGANGIAGAPKDVLAQMYWVRQANNPIILEVDDSIADIKLGKGTLADLRGTSLDSCLETAVLGGLASFVGRGVPTMIDVMQKLTPFTLGQATYRVLGMAAFYGGAQGLGDITYLQPWVLLHKALGRGEGDAIMKMAEKGTIPLQDAKACITAMNHFAGAFGIRIG